MNASSLSLSKAAQNCARGEKVIIEIFFGKQVICDRLHDLGLRPGAILEYWGRAPLQGPFLFRFQNIMLALRTEETDCVQVSLQKENLQKENQ